MTTIVTRNGMRVVKTVTCLRCGYVEHVCHCHWSDLPMRIEEAMNEVRERIGYPPVDYGIWRTWGRS